MERNAGDAGRRFFLGFVLTLLVMVPMGVEIWRWRSAQTARKEAEEVAMPARMAVSQPYNLLIGCEEPDGELIACALIRCDPAQGRFTAATLPADTVVLYKQTLLPVDELTALCGFRTAAAGVSETLGVPVEYALCLSSDAVAGFIDQMGGYPIVLSHDLVGIGKTGLIEFRLFAGRAQIFGAETVYILRHGLSDADGDPAVLERRMLEAALTAFAAKGFGDDPAALLTALLDDADTDIGAADIAPILRPLSDICAAGGPVTAFAFTGEQADEGFLLDEEAARAAARFFGAPEREEP